MSFLLNYPAHAGLECSECQKWIYDIQTCEPKKRGGKIQPRPPGVPTPCQSCPKKSPENWERIKPTRRTYATLELYRRNKATFGRTLNEHEADDEWLQKNFAILDEVFQANENANQHRAQQRAIHNLIKTMRR